MGRQPANISFFKYNKNLQRKYLFYTPQRIMRRRIISEVPVAWVLACASA